VGRLARQLGRRARCGISTRITSRNVGLVGEIPLQELARNWATPAIDPVQQLPPQRAGRQGLCAPDLQVYDLDVDYNNVPNLDMTVWVANLGCLASARACRSRSTPEGKGLLGTVLTQGPLAAGAAEQVSLSVAQRRRGAQIYAVVDDNGMNKGELNECKERQQLDRAAARVRESRE
jgi:hypothetical protein